MINFIIGISLVGYAYFAIKNQQKALRLLLFLLPAYLIRSSILGIPFTLLEGLILILFAVWFFQNYREVLGRVRARYQNNDAQIRAYPFAFELVLWLIFAFVAVWVANFSNAAFGVWKAYFFEPALVYILIYNIFASSGDSQRQFIENLILAISTSALVVALYAILQKFNAWGIENPFWADEATRRVTSFFDYPNAVGLFLAPVMILSLALLFDIYKKQGDKYLIYKKVILVSSLLSSFLAIYFAKSEGALVAVFVATLLLLLVLLVKNFKLLQIILFSNIVLIVLFVFLSPVVYNYLVPKYAYPDFGTSLANQIYDKITLKDFSGEVRKQQWQETWEMMGDKNRWFWGAGISFYQESVAAYHQEGIFFNRERDPDFRRKLVLFDEEYKAKYWYPVEIYLYPHNLLLNFWTEMGLFAVLLFVWIIVTFFLMAFKLFRLENKYLVAGVALAMLTILIHGIVDVPYFKNDLALIFCLLVGMMGILSLKPGKVEEL